MTVDAKDLDRIVAAFKKDKSWQFIGDKPINRLYRHMGFFVRRRADKLGTDDPAWFAENDLHSLKKRINSEFDAMLAYLGTKLGSSTHRGPLYGGPGDANPPHLDLADVAQRKTSEPATTVADAVAHPGDKGVKFRAWNNYETRRLRILAICFRAAAIHSELWKPSADSSSATLAEAALSEVLDRRLRVAERMNYNVSDHRAMGGDKTPLQFDAATSGWKDGFRVRLFEYPRVDKARYTTIVGTDVDKSPTPKFGAKHWYDPDDGRFWWNVGPFPGIRFPPALAPHFRQVAEPGTPDKDDSYRLRIAPAAGKSGADVFDLLFPATGPEDRWDRPWLFCDHVIAALHFEALRFSKKRRDTGAGDGPFNAIFTGNYPGYVSLKPLVLTKAGEADSHELGADKLDKVFFENHDIPEADLQVGDHLIFWNSFAYDSIEDGEWALENSIVVGVDSDPGTGGHHRSQLMLQGHGTDERLYADYVNDVGGYFWRSLKKLQQRVRSFAASNPNATEMSWLGDPHRVVKWSPYESFPAPGAWWVCIATTDFGSGAAGDDAAAAAIHKSVAADTHAGTGYNWPPRSPGNVYFPLFEPNVHGGWATYLSKRKAQPAFRARGVNLQDVKVDGDSIPGLFHDGAQAQHNTIPALRPRVHL